MITLAQEFKLSKTYEKRLYNRIRVVPCKRQLQKTPNILKMTSFRNGRHVGLYAEHMALKICQFGSNIKIVKNLQTSLLKLHLSCFRQKQVQKTPSI